VQVAKSNGAGAWSCGTDNVRTAPTFPNCFDRQLLRFGADVALSCASLPPAPILGAAFNGDYPVVVIPADGLPMVA
jgi:hypothetical protein